MGTLPPLEIPEIVSNVLQFCDYPTLFRAAQVNSVWAEHATNVPSPFIECFRDIHN